MAKRAQQVIWASILAAGFTVSLGFADEVVHPSHEKGWGGGDTAESLLNMNRDPESVRKVDPDKVPIPIRGICTDDHGKSYTGEDEEYSLCMNRKSSKGKMVAPASVPSVAPGKK